MLTKSIHESKNNLADNSSSNSNLIILHKQAFYSIAKCIAVLTINNKTDGQLIVQQFINDIRVLIEFLSFFST
jgi:hypothetical protein